MKKFLVLVAGVLVFASCSKKDVVQNPVEKDAPAVSEYGSGGSDQGMAGDLVTINFDYDKAALTEAAKTKLKNNVTWLKANSSMFIQIEGHCDNRGTIEYNLALGEKRAIAVQTYLLKLGVAKKRLSIISYGEERPVSMQDDESGWAANRRANFVIISK